VGVTGAIYAIRKSLWTPLPAACCWTICNTPMQMCYEDIGGVRDGCPGLETRLPSPSEEYRRKTRTLTGVIQLCAWLPAFSTRFATLSGRNSCSQAVRFLTPYCALVIGALVSRHRVAFLTGRGLCGQVPLPWRCCGPGSGRRPREGVPCHGRASVLAAGRGCWSRRSTA